MKNKLYVVGMGPGAADRMSIRADETLKKCDTIIGYTVYVNLLKRGLSGKRIPDDADDAGSKAL